MNNPNRSKFLTQVRYFPYLPNEMEYCLRREISQKTFPGCRCLDLMAGCFTYIPDYVEASEVIGVGLNRDELLFNKSLTGFIIQDINKNTTLPFDDSYFDIITLTSGMAYLKNPETLFHSVVQALKPGGTLFVGFTDRQYDDDTTKMWTKMKAHEKTIYTKKSILSCSEIFNVQQKIFLYDTSNKNNDECSKLELFMAVKKAKNTQNAVPEQISLTIESFNALSASKCLLPLIENQIFDIGNYIISYNTSAFDQSCIALPYLKESLLSRHMKNTGITVEFLPFFEEFDFHGPVINVQFNEFQS